MFSTLVFAWLKARWKVVVPATAVLAFAAYQIPPAIQRNLQTAENVQEMLNGKAASGSSVQTTATGTSGSPVVTLASAASYRPGHGMVVGAGGAAHGISTPANAFAVPRTVYATLPNSNSLYAPIPFTASTSTHRLTLPANLDTTADIAVPNGQRVRLHNQGGALPTVGGVPLTEGTNYYIRPFPEVRTFAIGGTPTGGTFRVHPSLLRRNGDFDVVQDSSLYVNIPYNAAVEVQTVAIQGAPTGGTFTITVPSYGTTASISHNASATTVRDALRALTGLSRINVTSSGTLPSTVTYTVTFDGVSANVSQMTSTSSLTGGTPSIAHASTINGTSLNFEGYLRRLPGYAQITTTQAGSLPNLTHTITFNGVSGVTTVTYDLSDLTGGTPTVAVAQVTAGGHRLYTTANDAINDTNALEFDGTGSGTHYLEVYGTETYSFRVAALSGNGGVTQATATFSTSVGPHECSEHEQICIVFDRPTGSKGFAIWGDNSSNYQRLALVHGINWIRRVNLSASGFTPFEAGDIGRSLSDGTTTGTIECYDNSSRNVWVKAGLTALPTDGATLTTSGGTGGGTQSGASVAANMWVYNGRRFKREYNYYACLARRSGEKCYPGQLMQLNNNLYRCIEVDIDRRTAPELPFTYNASTNVITTSGSSAAGTNGKLVYVRASCALPEISGGRLREGVGYYARYNGGSSLTLHPTSADAINNTNVIDLTTEGLGTYYIVDSGSFATGVGSLVTDDAVKWRREDILVPAAPPDADIPDALWARVVSISGNNVTLNTNLVSSVTSTLTLHDDTDAILEHFNNVKSSNRKSARLFFPSGDYNLVTKVASDDSRLFNSTFGSGDNYYLFRHTTSNNSTLNSEWIGEAGTRIILASTDNSAGIKDGEGSDYRLYVHTFGKCRPIFRNIAWCNWSVGVPVMEHPDGTGGDQIWAYDVDSTSGSGVNSGARVDGPSFYGGGFYGFTGCGGSSWANGISTSEHFEDFDAYVGGSNHNQGFYINGGNLINVRAIRIRAEGSMGVYQDASEAVPLTLDGCYFEGWRKNGAVAVRGSNFRCLNSDFVDSVRLFAREWVTGYQVMNCSFYETDINPNNSSNNGSLDTQIDNIRMVDCGINIGNLCEDIKISNVNIQITARPRYISTAQTSTCCTFSGTRQHISNVTIDNRAAVTTQYGCVSFAGAGTNYYEGVRVLHSSGGWRTFGTSGSGYQLFNSCEFHTINGASTANLTQHTGDTKWINCKFSGSPYTFTAGGRTEFDLCRTDSGCSLTFSSTLTGPLTINRCSFLGTTAVQEPDSVITNCTFASSPSLSGATLSLQNNRVGDNPQVAAASPISSSMNNYALPVTNTFVISLTGNQNLTGILARANGDEYTIVNSDATDTLTVKHLDGTSSSTNQIRTPDGNDLLIGPGATLTLRRANTIWYATGPPPEAGVTFVGTEEAGRLPKYDAQTGDYRLYRDGRGVDVTAYGASGRSEQAFADVVSSTMTLETGYDSTWPDDVDPENNCVGWKGLILGAGPTHSVAAPSTIRVVQFGTTGTTKRSYQLVSKTGRLGHSAKSTSVEITNSYSVLNKDNYIGIFWRRVTDAVDYAVYHEVYDPTPNDNNKFHIADVHGCPTCYEVPCNGVTNYTDTDIGDKVTQSGTGDTGTLVGYINSDPANSNNGTIWIVPEIGDNTGDTFDGTGAITVNGHSGTPVSSSSQIMSVYWHDRGNLFYEATVTGGGDDWSNIYFNRRFYRSPTRGGIRFANDPPLTIDTNTGILSVGQDEGDPTSFDDTANLIFFQPFTPRDQFDAASGHEIYIRGKSITGTLDGTAGIVIDTHRIGDTIIEPFTSAGKRFRLRRRNDHAMTANDTMEKQQIVIAGTPGTGTWTLTNSDFGTTANIAIGATAKQVEDALRAVPGLEQTVVGITAGTTPNFTYQVYFVGVKGNTPQMTSSNTFDQGTITITTLTAGSGEDFTVLAMNESLQDGLHLYWRREEADVPTNPPPTSAMPDAQPFVVTAVNGTTLTIDTDPSTPGNQGVTTDVDRTPGSSSVAGLVLHNDAGAFREAIAVAMAGPVHTLYVPDGDYELFCSMGTDWDLDGSNDVTTFNFDQRGALFYLNSATSKLHFDVAPEATIWFRPAAVASKLDGAGDVPEADDMQNGIPISMLELEQIAGFTWIGGQCNFCPIAGPLGQFYEGYSMVTLFGGNQPRETNVLLSHAEFWGWGALFSLNAYRGEQGQTQVEYCKWDWGGAGHTAGFVSTENPSIAHCQLYGADGGVRANSSVFYTDTNPPGTTFFMDDVYIYNSRYNIRVRSPHILFSNVVFDECATAIFEGGTYDGHFNNVSWLNCDVVDNNLLESTGTGCTFFNTQINFSSGTHAWGDCVCSTTRYDTGSVGFPILISSGNVSLDNWMLKNNDSDLTRGISISGGTKIRLSNFNFEQGNADELWTFGTTSAFKGDLWVSDSRFTSKGGPIGFSWSSTVGRVHLNNVEFESMNSPADEISAQPCWIDAKDCTFKCQFTVGSSGLTGAAQAGAAGSITLASGAEGSVDDVYEGWQVVNETTGEIRFITGYTASTKVATVSPNWSAGNPANGTNYTLLPPQIYENCRFMSTTADSFGVRGSIFKGNDFNVHPTIPDSYIKGNTIRGSGVYTPAALALGSQELGRYVTDYIRLDPNSGNSTITGIPQMFGGVEYTYVNVDAGAATLTWDDNSGVDELTEILSSTGADIGPDSVNKTRVFWRDDVTGKWRDK